jgi:hypothetical protein
MDYCDFLLDATMINELVDCGGWEWFCNGAWRHWSWGGSSCRICLVLGKGLSLHRPAWVNIEEAGSLYGSRMLYSYCCCIMYILPRECLLWVRSLLSHLHWTQLYLHWTQLCQDTQEGPCGIKMLVQFIWLARHRIREPYGVVLSMVPRYCEACGCSAQ